MPTTHIALLRGINVGGKNKLPMANLRAIFESLGCESVQTYIQSGNVLFNAKPALIKTLADNVSKQIKSELNLTVPVILRTANQLKKTIDACPFADRANADRLVHIFFLADRPTQAQLKSFNPPLAKGEQLEIIGNELHLHLPNGIAKTKLTNASLDRALKTTTTARNWRTTNKLLKLAAAPIP